MTSSPDMPIVEAPFSERTVRVLSEFQDAGSDGVYRCKDASHEQPLAPYKGGMMCRERGCSYSQDWTYMFLEDTYVKME